MIALMVGSKGWPAGESTHFPAVDLSQSEIKQIFDTIPKQRIIQIVFTDNEQEKARQGYHGMAIVLGEKTA